MNISHATVTVSELCRWARHGHTDKEKYLEKSWHLLRYQYQSDRCCIPRIQAQGTHSYTPKLGTGIMTNRQERDADTPERCIDSFLYYFFCFFFLLARRRRFCPLSLVHFGFVYTSALIMNRYIEHSRGLSCGGGTRELWQCPLFYILTYL